MRDGKGDSVHRILFGGLVLACACFTFHADTTVGGVDKSKNSSMRFEWRTEGPPDLCGKLCRRWISAIGPITESTPREFEAFAAKSDIRGATLVLDSEGGSVVDTIELGRAIRRYGLTTTIGKTVASSSPDGAASATLSPAASCESMCAFVLLSGARRYVPPEARVLVHQIWLAKKRERAEAASYTADELVLVQRDIGSLAHYTIEMGGGIELLETALRVPPWEPLYRLSNEEIQRMGLNTVDHPFESAVPEGATASRLGTSFAKAPPTSVGSN
jgi:hypothetical protein